MGTATMVSEAKVLVPLEEYLATSYHPDVDFLEGELQERNMGEWPHSKLQIYLGFLFRLHQREWNAEILSEQRVQVAANRFRIPDLCVIPMKAVRTPILAAPPLLCIEILSKADTVWNLQARVDDYFRMGVENVWAIDPWQRVAYYCTPRGFNQPTDGTLRIDGTPIVVELAEVFAELDPQ